MLRHSEGNSNWIRGHDDCLLIIGESVLSLLESATLDEMDGTRVRRLE